MQGKNFEEEVARSAQQLSRCEWVKEEFREASFGDRRLFLRFLVVAEHLARHPEAPINQASEAWNKTKAAYRFFDNEKVTGELVLAPHVRKTIERMQRHSGTVLVIQDTSFLNYSHMKCSSDLGPIGELKEAHMGLVMHTALGVTEDGLPLGVVDQKLWARSPEEHGKGAQRAQKPIEEKESFKWLEALRSYHSLFSGELDVVSLGDSEADIYDLFSEAQQLQAKLLVRSKHDRRTMDGKLLWDLVAQQPRAFADIVHLPARPDRSKRDAIVEVRFATTQIRCPKNKPKRNDPPHIRISVVYVHEVAPPPNEEPIEWMLATNVPIRTAREAQQRIRWYRQRWQIEVFHRILKSGCNIELTRLETNERRFPYISLNSIIAWKLLLLTHYNRIAPESPATSLLTQTECNVLYAVTHNREVKKRAFNAQKATRWLAQLGGFLARQHDGVPGPTHVWRGWQRLQDFTQMYVLTMTHPHPTLLPPPRGQ